MPDEFVGDAGVAQVVTDAESDFAPRRIPDFLYRRPQAVLEKLDGHAFDLLENHLAVRADDEGGVVVMIRADRFFTADNQKSSMIAAPVLQRVRRRAVERVFAQDKDGRIGVFGESLVEDFRNDVFRRELHLDADNRQFWPSRARVTR